MSQPSPTSPVPRRWLILRRLAFSPRAAIIVSDVGFFGGVIYCLVDVVIKTMGGSFSWLFAIGQFIADVAVVGFDAGLLMLLLLGLSSLLKHLIPSEYRTHPVLAPRDIGTKKRQK